MTIIELPTVVITFGREPAMKNESLMTIPELMKFLQVKRNTIYTLRRLGLPTVKIGRSVRFRLDSILQWLGDMERSSSSDVKNLLDGDSSHLL
jgi:excisionase family DNA binding protein